MIRQQAFIGEGKMLKGNLHCHTTRSDGVLTPEEIIRIYKAHGYDFLALTDHRIYNYIDYAPEEGLTIIPGMEFDNGNMVTCGLRCFHTVCIGPPKEDGNGFEQDDTFPQASEKTQETYQVRLDEIHEKKNLTIYCHPQWSSTPARYFEKLRGNFAMEVWNSDCALEYDMDRDAAYWDELLEQGIRIWGVASDDSHNRAHCCNGWVRVRAENNVNAILKALEAGEFYASCGPEIYDFYVDGDKAVVECSPAHKIRLHSMLHPSTMRVSEDGTLTRAEFDLNWCWGYDNYVRATVIDKDGKYAWTNPIFLK